MIPRAFRRRGFNARLAELFNKLGACGNIGLIIGIMAGGLLTLLSIRTVHLRPILAEVFWIVVILSLFCWIIMLLIGTVFIRLQLRSIVWGMLVRSVVICLFTVLFAQWLGIYRYGLIVGIVVGLFFGYVVCWIRKRVRG